MFSLLLIAPAFGAGPDLCEVLNQREKYKDKVIVVHGVVTWHEHYPTLDALPRCPQGESSVAILGVDFDKYHDAGGSKGHGVLAVVEGKIGITSKYLPELSKKAYMAFDASTITYKSKRR